MRIWAIYDNREDHNAIEDARLFDTKEQATEEAQRINRARLAAYNARRTKWGDFPRPSLPVLERVDVVSLEVEQAVPSEKVKAAVSKLREWVHG